MTLDFIYDKMYLKVGNDMNRANQYFESALEKLARAMSRKYDVNVIIEGNLCCTDGKNIYLPRLEEMDPETFRDLSGFLDHETAHIKFTDFPLLQAKVKTRFEQELINAFEDSRIEILMEKEYPGCGYNLDRMNEKWQGKNMELRDTFVMPVRLIIALRQLYDGKIPIVDPDFQRLYDVCAPEVKKNLDAESTEQIQKMVAKIREIILKEREKIKEEEKAERGETGEGEEGQADSQTNNQGRPTKGKDKSGKPHRPRMSNNIDKELEEMEEEESHQSQKSQKVGDGEESESSGEDSERQKNTKQRQQKKDCGVNPSEIERRKNYASWVEEQKVIDALMEEEAQYGKESGSVVSDQENTESEFDKSISSPETYMEIQLKDIIEKEPSTDLYKGYYSRGSAYKEAISIPFTTRFDEVKNEVGKGSVLEYGKLKHGIMSQINPSKALLEEVLKAKENARFRHERERGMLNHRDLSKLVTNSGYRTPFKEFIKTETNDVAVEILVDLSGSMSGEKAYTARQTTIALVESLQGLGIMCEVTGFNSSGDSRLSSLATTLGAAETSRFNRFGERLIHYIFKDFENPNTLGLQQMKAGGANCDGESVIWAAKRLALRKEKRKIMMVLSDGQPSISGSDHEILAGDLKRVVRLIKQSEIEIIGVGILTEDVKLFYPEYVVVKDLKGLARQTVSKISEILRRNLNQL